MLCHVEKVLSSFRYTVHDVREEHFLIKIGILLLGEELRQLDSVRRIDFIFAVQLNMQYVRLIVHGYDGSTTDTLYGNTREENKVMSKRDIGEMATSKKLEGDVEEN